MLAYTSYMAERLTECWRLLKDSGSLFLHCDPTAGHYLKILLDVIFGSASFRNEIVWCYPPGGSGPKLAFHRKHDLIYYYGKSQKVGTFHRPYGDLPESTRLTYRKIDEDGRRYKEYPGGRTYLDEIDGRPIPDWWTDIVSLGQAVSAKERLGYPTQKPVALLERILRAASDEGDLVLDPFCGCGTTIDAAQRLNRRWLGIDISPFAIDLIRERRLPELEIPTHGIPIDLASAERLAQEKPFDFEKWAVTRIEGLLPNERQVGDGGIDGRGQLLNPTAEMEPGLVLAQVKGGGFSQNDLRAFKGVMADEGAAFGVFITLTRLRKNNAAKRRLSPPAPASTNRAPTATLAYNSGRSRTISRGVTQSCPPWPTPIPAKRSNGRCGCRCGISRPPHSGTSKGRRSLPLQSDRGMKIKKTLG